MVAEKGLVDQRSCMKEGKMAGWDAGTSGATRTWNARACKSRPADQASDQKVEQSPSSKAQQTFIMVCSSPVFLSQASTNLP